MAYDFHFDQSRNYVKFKKFFQFTYEVFQVQTLFSNCIMIDKPGRMSLYFRSYANINLFTVEVAHYMILQRALILRKIIFF